MTGCDTTTVAASAGTETSGMLFNVMQAKADICATNEALGGGKKKKTIKKTKTVRKNKPKKKKQIKKINTVRRNKSRKQQRKKMKSNPTLKQKKYGKHQ